MVRRNGKEEPALHGYGRCDCSAVLDAAEEVVLRDGIGRLTLDAVARETRLSKSGLLHHFPSKEALVDALVDRKVNEWLEDTRSGYEAAAPGPGRAARALLATCLSSTDQWTDAMRRSSVVLVAALVHNSKHVEPLRKANREMHQRFGGDGLPPGVGDLIHLVVHGMWFDWIFGLSDWSPQRLAAVRQAIQRVLDGHLPRASSAGSRKPAVKRAGKVAAQAKKKASKKLNTKVGKRPSTRQRTRGTRS